MSLLVELAQARLTAEGEPPAYVVDAPSDPGRAYILLAPSPGTSTPERLGASPSRHVDRLTVMAVSDTATGCLRVADRVREQLTGWNPKPSDTSQSPLVEYDSGPVLPDRSETVTRYTTTIFYRAHRRRRALP